MVESFDLVCAQIIELKQSKTSPNTAFILTPKISLVIIIGQIGINKKPHSIESGSLQNLTTKTTQEGQILVLKHKISTRLMLRRFQHLEV